MSSSNFFIIKLKRIISLKFSVWKENTKFRIFRVRVYGPGVEPTGVVVGAPATFTVETFSAGRGQVEVFVENPLGQQEPVEIKVNNDRNSTYYSVMYTPHYEGVHTVQVKFAGKNVPKSPFVVKVEGQPGDPTKVTVSGPGVQPDGNFINRPNYFDIHTKSKHHPLTIFNDL